MPIRGLENPASSASAVEFADLQHRLKGTDREAPRALAAARIEPGQGRDDRRETRDHADLAVARQHRRPFDRTNRFYEASEAAAYGVGDRVIAIGSVFAEP